MLVTTSAQFRTLTQTNKTHRYPIHKDHLTSHPKYRTKTRCQHKHKPDHKPKTVRLHHSNFLGPLMAWIYKGLKKPLRINKYKANSRETKNTHWSAKGTKTQSTTVRNKGDFQHSDEMSKDPALERVGDNVEGRVLSSFNQEGLLPLKPCSFLNFQSTKTALKKMSPSSALQKILNCPLESSIWKLLKAQQAKEILPPSISTSKD